MKYQLLVLVVLGGVFMEAAKAQTEDTYLIRKVIERADFDFANQNMYKNQASWIGKTISFRGTIQPKPVIVADNKDYIQINGSGASGEVIDVVAFLDTPLPTPSGIQDNAPTISKGQSVYVFGVLQKCRDFVDRSGYVRYLPTLECLLLFDRDDREFAHPIWLSRTLKRN